MVNIFPDLLAFSLLAPFIIRLFIGFYFITWGWSAMRQNDIEQQGGKRLKQGLGFIGFASGLFVLAGAFTQVAVLVLLGLLVYLLKTSRNRLSYILLFGMALSLLLSGAGIFAFDLPL
tara:strand:- start:141 stop:494 length:354 start_codon:yes stop_codon:yes gene_type:complete